MKMILSERGIKGVIFLMDTKMRIYQLIMMYMSEHNGLKLYLWTKSSACISIEYMFKAHRLEN